MQMLTRVCCASWETGCRTGVDELLMRAVPSLLFRDLLLDSRNLSCRVSGTDPGESSEAAQALQLEKEIRRTRSVGSTSRTNFCCFRSYKTEKN